MFVAPSAATSTIRARIANACAVEGRRDHRSSTSRSSSLNVTVAVGRPARPIGHLHHHAMTGPTRPTHRKFRLRQDLPTQDTRSSLGGPFRAALRSSSASISFGAGCGVVVGRTSALAESPSRPRPHAVERPTRITGYTPETWPIRHNALMYVLSSIAYAATGDRGASLSRIECWARKGRVRVCPAVDEHGGDGPR